MGLRCRKNNFLIAIRNPIYCGKIRVNKFKDEESYFVKGIHTPLISETLFYQVQDVLDGNVREIKTRLLSQNLLPLKGFMGCPRCGRTLCASASKGRNNYYHYYHCSSKCGYRLKAEEVNAEFAAFLKLLVPNHKATELFRMVILDTYASDTAENKERKAALAKELTEESNKLARARELLLMGDIDGTDFKEIKSACEKRILAIESHLAELGKTKLSKNQLEPIVDNVLQTLAKLDEIYLKTDIEHKRRLIGSMFQKKFTFDELKARTAKISQTFNCIFLGSYRKFGG